MSNVRRQRDPDPVGIAVLGIILMGAIIAVLLCAFHPGTGTVDVLFDLASLGFALFTLAVIRWLWQALMNWRNIYRNWKPPNDHENDHRTGHHHH